MPGFTSTIISCTSEGEKTTFVWRVGRVNTVRYDERTRTRTRTRQGRGAGGAGAGAEGEEERRTALVVNETYTQGTRRKRENTDLGNREHGGSNRDIRTKFYILGRLQKIAREKGAINKECVRQAV